MTTYDLVVRGGTLVTAERTEALDIAISGGVIADLGRELAAGREEIDASGKLVLPGGIDSHCHVEQVSSTGLLTADDFYSATVSAAFGGTTTIIPFAAQHRGQSLRRVVEDYHACAGPKAVVDYGFHMIISDPTETVLTEELPGLIAEGCSSFKVYMTYESLRLDDVQILNVMGVARREGALVMVHAENHEMIRWLTGKLLDLGHERPRYHALSHPRLAESEATHRAIALGELMDTPVLVVHVSSTEARDEIRRAQDRGLKVYGETCPQYLFLTGADLDREGMDGAMYCCSPPPRDQATQEAIWQGLSDGTFQVFSSDHAGYRFDDTGKLAAGARAPFPKIANGVPGLELRMPLLFTEGVGLGRIDLQRFVSLTATQAAKLYGLYPRKGEVAVGSDADLAIWDPEREVEIHHGLLHDRTGYTPYAGRRLRGWPETVLSRGRIAIQSGELKVEAGSGEFLPCGLSEAARPLGRRVSEMDPERNFGVDLLEGERG